MINKINTGQVIKNYKVLCEILGHKVKAGKSKRLHIKDLERYFKFHFDKQKIIIDEVYDTPKEKVDGRATNGAILKEYEQYLIDNKYNNCIGVYSIILDNTIYIGSTIVGFRSRFIQHMSGTNQLKTKEMLLNGAKFDILEIVDNINIDELHIRKLENKYIKKYKSNLNWNVINTNETWSFKPKQKIKYKNIKINSNYYNKAIEILHMYNII